MKKYFIVSAMLAMTLSLSNCAKREVTATYDPSDNLDVVNLSLATAKNLTRGADTYTSSLENGADATNGKDFYVRVVSEANPATIAPFNLTFRYDGSKWNQTGADMEGVTGDLATGKLKWSDIEMPARFYSIFTSDDSQQTDGVATTGTSSLLTSATNTDGVDDVEFTQVASTTGESQNHKDVVYAAQEVTSTPIGGKVTMTFSHILSKIDVFVQTQDAGADASTAFTSHIQSATLKTVMPTASIQPDFSLNNKGAITSLWSATSGTAVDYGYFVNDNTKSATDPETWSGEKQQIQLDANGAMMIVPQTLTGLAINANDDGKMTLPVAGDDKSYVEVIYYSTDANGGSFAGYKAASESWTYDASCDGSIINADAAYWDKANKTWYTDDTKGTVVTKYDSENDKWLDAADAEVTAGTNGYFAYPAATDALYVKVAFPFEATNGQEFAPGKYYHLILGMGSKGSSGGYLLEKNFYDKDGNKLPIVVNDQVIEPGDPIAPDADGIIGIVVLVNDWDDPTDTDVKDSQSQTTNN